MQKITLKKCLKFLAEMKGWRGARKDKKMTRNVQAKTQKHTHPNVCEVLLRKLTTKHSLLKFSFVLRF